MMKLKIRHICFLLFFIAFKTSNAAGLVFIPDTNLLNHFKISYPTLIFNDSLIVDSALTLTDSLDLNNLNIYNAEGVQHFSKVKTLILSYNNLTSLPSLSNMDSLRFLYLKNNQLTSLPDLSSNKIINILNFSNNQVNTFPNVKGLNKMWELSFTSNNISIIPDSILNTLTGLTNLFCNSNLLNNLPGLSALKDLTWLYCGVNQLASLPTLSVNTNLVGLHCASNDLMVLPDLSNNTNLKYIYCEDNLLTELPDLTNNTQLYLLTAHYNQLNSLPDLSNKNSLNYFYVEKNKLDYSDARELRIAGNLPALKTFQYSPQNPFGNKDTLSGIKGSKITLTIAKQDSATNYQWYKDGMQLPLATDTSLTINILKSTDAGSYTCKSYGTALDSIKLNFFPGLYEFESEPILLNVYDVTVGCTAFYSYTIDTVNNNIISFNESSSGVYSEYHWDFGDGSFAGTENPTHDFKKSGIYEICMTIFEPANGCSDMYCENIQIGTDTAACYIISDFSGTVDSLKKITFTNLSQNYNRSYWEFGDGKVNTSENPVHQFEKAGPYEICLIVFNDTSSCIDKSCQIINIIPDSVDLKDTSICLIIPKFNFVKNNLSAQFSDISEGIVTKRFWDFGDGYSSSLKFPQHQYSESGTYEVCLTLYNDTTRCSKQLCKRITLFTDSNICIANYNFFILKNDSVLFIDKSFGNFTNWFWNFGDGVVSNKRNIIHRFPGAGSYFTCLTVFNTSDSCIDHRCETVRIIDTTAASCESFFTFVVDSSTNTVIFKDQSSGNPDYWYWNFNDYTPASILQNPSHSYATGGFYEVCLTIYKGADCKDTYCKVISVGNVSNSVFADFHFFPDSLTAVVIFKNRSYGNITNYNWDFGDDGFSILKTPSHTYADTGRYLVCLTVKASSGVTDFKCKYVEIGNSLKNECDFSCVWPGDANHDLEANHYDLIAIGLNFNKTGPKRDSLSIRHIGHFGNDWDTEQITGTNNKHSDCNGDGIISLEDIKAIRSNFAFSHPYKPGKTSSNNYNPANPDLYFDILPDDIAPGTSVEVAIMVGRDTIQLYGIGFEVKVDVNKIQENSVKVNYDNSWLGKKDSNMVVFDTTIYNGSLNKDSFISLSKNDQKQQAGYGEICRYKFTVDSTLTENDEISICLNSYYGMDENGDTISINGICDTLKINDPNCIDPVSAFNYTINGHVIQFIDSSENANSWLWNYGDGNISTSQNPKHTYSDTGTYKICLYTQNQCGKDTLCKDIYISSTVFISEKMKIQNLKIYPNPTKGIINFELPVIISGEYDLKITNLLGQEIQTIYNINLSNSKGGMQQFDFSNYNSGMFFIEIISEQIIYKQHFILKK